jgi:hypothetical protein
MRRGNAHFHDNLVSQQAEDLPMEIRRQLVDVGAILIRRSLHVASLPKNCSPIVPTNLLPVLTQDTVAKTVVFDSQETQLSVTDIADNDSDEPLPKKQRRSRFKYANRKLLSNLHLFLNPKCGSDFSDEHVLLTGQIRQCPHASNGRQCIIGWTKMAKNANFPVPAEHMRTTIHGNAGVDILVQEACLKYDKQMLGSGVARASDDNVARATSVQQTPTNLIVAQEATASIITSSSTISSQLILSGRDWLQAMEQLKQLSLIAQKVLT